MDAKAVVYWRKTAYRSNLGNLKKGYLGIKNGEKDRK